MEELRRVTSGLMMIMLVGTLNIWHACSVMASTNATTQKLQETGKPLVVEDSNGARVYYLRIVHH